MVIVVIILFDGEGSQKAILQGLDEIKQTTQDINTKMDIVLEKLTKLENEFTDLKNENRNLEQKITLMTSKLSKLDDSVRGNNWKIVMRWHKACIRIGWTYYKVYST